VAAGRLEVLVESAEEVVAVSLLASRCMREVVVVEGCSRSPYCCSLTESETCGESSGERSAASEDTGLRRQVRRGLEHFEEAVEALPKAEAVVGVWREVERRVTALGRDRSGFAALDASQPWR
jgi:hypothetical protein